MGDLFLEIFIVQDFQIGFCLFSFSILVKYVFLKLGIFKVVEV